MRDQKVYRIVQRPRDSGTKTQWWSLNQGWLEDGGLDATILPHAVAIEVRTALRHATEALGDWTVIAHGLSPCQ